MDVIEGKKKEAEIVYMSGHKDRIFLDSNQVRIEGWGEDIAIPLE